MSTEPKKANFGRRIKRASLYLIPGYPVVRAFKSAKETMGSGCKTLRDLTVEIEKQKPKARRIVRTYREAISLRSADSLPLEQIARDRLNRKRLCLAFILVCASYAVGGLIVGNAIEVMNGILGISLPALFTVKFEHQLWQMEIGPQRPDEPLGGYRDFFRSHGALVRLLNPRLFS